MHSSILYNDILLDNEETSFEEEDDVRQVDIVNVVPARQETEMVPDTKLLVFDLKQFKHKFTELHL